MAKNEEKPYPEICTSQKMKFSAKLVDKNAILNGIYFLFIFRFSRKMVQNFSFFAKFENAKKMGAIMSSKNAVMLQINMSFTC